MSIERSASTQFLRRHSPDGPWSLFTFTPRVTSASAANDAETDAFLARHSAQDLYFLLGEPKSALKKKPKKEDMAGSRWCWCDLDPRAGEDLEAEQKRILSRLTTNLPAGVPAPTLIVYSGRGYWALWQLSELCTDAALVEGVNRRLANLFGALGDDCWNIDRVGRLPGTVNRKTGRVACVVSDDPALVYAIDALPAPEVTTETTAQAGAEVNVAAEVGDFDLDRLDEWHVPDRVKLILQDGHGLETTKDGDSSRSAWLFDAVCNLARCGVPDQVVFDAICAPNLGIADAVRRERHGSTLRARRNWRKYALHQIENAKKVVASDAMEFVCDQHGKIVPANQRNIRVALHRLGVSVRHDVFRDHLLISGLPGTGPVMDDAAMSRLWLRIDEQFGFRPTREFFWTVVEDCARRDAFHPVRDYLDALEWDGVARVDGWLANYGGAEDSAYVRAVGALVLIAAVRRARQPGCKFDEMLVLESAQGTLKSSALRLLAVNEDWFSDDLPLNADSQRVIEALAGHWIVEAAELKGMRKGDVEHLKSFLSRAVDRARMAYARLTTTVPRQCMIVGTTNSSQYLRDSTGNRRFWPVHVARFDLVALGRDRDQLWAEAAAREAKGESIRLDPSLYAEAAAVQEARRVEDPYVQTLAAVLGTLNGKLCAEDVWLILGVEKQHRTQDHNARLGEAMRELGFERTKARFGGAPVWCYARGTEIERATALSVWREGTDGKVHAIAGEREREPF